MSPGATPPRPFHAVTVVWGRAYIELFLDVAVPNQLTPGNLGALPAGSRYRVFTAQEDVEALAASPLLGRVKALMPVDLVVMPELSGSSREALSLMTAGHCRALGEAREAHAALVFLNADHFMSEGALATVVRRHETGSRAAASITVRLNKDTFVASVQARGGSRCVHPRELVSLALDHLHPFTCAHMIDGESSARRPIGVCWNVPNEGILARGFYLHPLMVAPLRREVLPVGTIDQHYLFHSCPVRERVHIVSDSDEFCLFELSHVEAAATEITSGGIPPWRAATVLSRCDSHQRSYWATPIRLHAHNIGAAWCSVEEESARFAQRAIRLRVAALWMYRSSRSVRPLRRRVGAFGKRLRRAAKTLSAKRVQRSVTLAARRTRKLPERTGRAGRRVLRRARRTVALLTHSAARPLYRVRKWTARAGRRALRRA